LGQAKKKPPSVTGVLSRVGALTVVRALLAARAALAAGLTHIVSSPAAGLRPSGEAQATEFSLARPAKPDRS
jgi:hypothetical protein